MEEEKKMARLMDMTPEERAAEKARIRKLREDFVRKHGNPTPLLSELMAPIVTPKKEG